MITETLETVGPMMDSRRMKAYWPEHCRLEACLDDRNARLLTIIPIVFSVCLAESRLVCDDRS